MRKPIIYGILQSMDVIGYFINAAVVKCFCVNKNFIKQSPEELTMIICIFDFFPGSFPAMVLTRRKWLPTAYSNERAFVQLGRVEDRLI